ncbi:MAG: thiamine ABC transporter substrate-binding protein [Desulfamplus sp.]|nr:thiamine ABC transporter substrate-binding protein [Desulfamplus sp.]
MIKRFYYIFSLSMPVVIIPFLLLCILAFITVSTGICQDAKKLTVMTHDSFSVSEKVVAVFEKENNAKLVFLKSGDAGEALNKAILSKNSPLADIFYGVDNTFLSRAIKGDIFLPYASPMLKSVDDKLKLDSENRLLPVDFGDVCLNYDKKWFADHKLAVPVMLEDLIKPEYKGLLVIENPATSSPGLAFLLTTISRFGETEAFEFWKKLKKNDVFITNGWKEAYWGKFSAASEGDRPIVVSYASSPAAEVHFAKAEDAATKDKDASTKDNDPSTKDKDASTKDKDSSTKNEDNPSKDSNGKKLGNNNTKDKDAPTGAVTEHGSAFRQIEFAGILKGTANLDLAQKLIDFLLSKTFQEDIPLQMFVFPSNHNAALPEVFQKYAIITTQPATLSYDEISEKREMWIEKWTELML